MASKKKEKIIHVCSINCPNCNTNINVFKKVKVVSPSVPADKEETFFAEKGTQTTLPGI